MLGTESIGIARPRPIDIYIKLCKSSPHWETSVTHVHEGQLKMTLVKSGTLLLD